MVLMRTAPRFFHKYPGKLVVLLKTAVRFSQKYFFKKHPSDFVDFSSGVPPVCLFAIPSLTNFSAAQTELCGQKTNPNQSKQNLVSNHHSHPVF